MSLALYACESNSAGLINDKGFKIRVDVDESENDVVDSSEPNPMKTKLKFIFETSDGLEPYFNHLYNKSEVKSLIASSGTDPDVLKRTCLSAVNVMIKELLKKYVALKCLSESRKLNAIEKSVVTSNNALYELFHWTAENMNEIQHAHNQLVDDVSQINSCHCNDPGGLHENFIELRDGFLEYISNVGSVMGPVVNTFNELYTDEVPKVRSILNNAYPRQSTIKTDEIINKITTVDDPYSRTDESKPVYGSMTIPLDLKVNGFINGVDITKITPIETYFSEQDGFNKYYVKNESVNLTDYTYDGILCNKLEIIDIPSSTISKLKQTMNAINVFRFVLRKNEIFDSSGAYIKDFYATVSNGKMYCPVIVKNESNAITPFDVYSVETNLTTEKPFIAFDKLISTNPLSLLMNGNMSIMYLLQQDTLTSSVPTIKCDIIDAKNALRLHESNVLYLYKPSAIGENDDYYTMRFNVPNDYTIPMNMNFVFTDRAFNNTWDLRWNGTKWTGNNIQGRLPSKSIHIVDNPVFEEGQHTKQFLFHFNIKHSNVNYQTLKRILPGLNENDNYAFELTWRDNHVKWHLILEDGSRKDISIFSYQTCDQELFNSVVLFKEWRTDNIQWRIPGYDVCLFMVQWKKDSQPYPWKELIGELTFDDITTTVKYVKGAEDHTDQYAHMHAINIIESIDVIGFKHQDTNTQDNVKDISIELLKRAAQNVDGIDWDHNTNAFQFMIDKQFYEISPNPNASTTLYTDFNITSSKIITADNITTMRSDLNVVTNQTDVIAYDVEVVKNRVDGINDRLYIAESNITVNKEHLNRIDGQITTIQNDCKELHKITDHIQAEVDEEQKAIKMLKIEAGIGLALGGAALLVGGVGTAVSLSAKGISFAASTAEVLTEETVIEGGMLFEEGEATASSLILDDLSDASWSSFSSVGYSNELSTPSMDNLKDWINKSLQRCSSTENKHVMSVKSVLELINANNQLMKAPFKILCDKVEEIQSNGNGNAFNSEYRLKNDLNYNEIKNKSLTVDVDYTLSNGQLALKQMYKRLRLIGTFTDDQTGGNPDIIHNFDITVSNTFPKSFSYEGTTMPYYNELIDNEFMFVYIDYRQLDNSIQTYASIVKATEFTLESMNCAISTVNYDSLIVDEEINDTLVLKSEMTNYRNKNDYSSGELMSMNVFPKIFKTGTKTLYYFKLNENTKYLGVQVSFHNGTSYTNETIPCTDFHVKTDAVINGEAVKLYTHDSSGPTTLNIYTKNSEEASSPGTHYVSLTTSDGVPLSFECLIWCNVNKDNGIIREFKISELEFNTKLDLFIMNDRVNRLEANQTSSTTITHYCPVEDDINDFSIGSPVFMSGNVFRNNRDGTFTKSTENDAQDCICSVKTKGIWKEFVGVCVEIDSEKKNIKFATHGDVLFKVDDANIYEIGDTVLYDGRIVDENYALSLKIQRSIVGIVSGKVGKNMISLMIQH